MRFTKQSVKEMLNSATSPACALLNTWSDAAREAAAEARHGSAGSNHIAKINKVYTRTYGDTGQKKTYVEWTDGAGKSGRTEGDANGSHMDALIKRGEREGVQHTHEAW